MDAVIRAVPLGDARTRLGASPPAPVERPGARIEPLSRPVHVAQDAAPDRAAERALLEASIRRELAAEAHELFAAERENGLAAGLEEGRRKAAEDNQAEVAKARTLKQQQFAALQSRLDQSIVVALQALSARAADLAFEAVCRIAGEHATSRQFVGAIVDEQVRRHLSAGLLTVRLHPQDMDLLRGDDDEASGPNPVQWMADEAVVLGGCLIDTPMGRYDARLETQLAKLKDIFTRARSGDDHG